jgi:hypothetical protein
MRLRSKPDVRLGAVVFLINIRSGVEEHEKPFDMYHLGVEFLVTIMADVTGILSSITANEHDRTTICQVTACDFATPFMRYGQHIETQTSRARKSISVKLVYVNPASCPNAMNAYKSLSLIPPCVYYF